MYSEKVMDHFSNPRNVGSMEDADGIGEVGNPVCGDMMTFYIKVKDDKIDDIKYKTFGCVAAIAVSSKVSEMIKGKSLEEAKAMSKKAVAEALDGLPKEKMHCSNLGAEALTEAINDYEEKKLGIPRPKTKESKVEGSEEHIICSQCSIQNPVTAKYCMNCGEGLANEC
jgi:nitrogen fixation NifU-like protein